MFSGPWEPGQQFNLWDFKNKYFQQLNMEKTHWGSFLKARWSKQGSQTLTEALRTAIYTNFCTQ